MWDSFIIQKASSFMRGVGRVYKYSYTELLLNGLVNYTKRVKESSLLYRYFMKQEKITEWWQNSFTYKVIQKLTDCLVNSVGQALRKIAEFNRGSLNHTVFVSCIIPLKYAGSLISAIFSVLLGFLMMNTISICYARTFTLYSICIRLFLIAICLVLSCTNHEKLFHAVKESRFVKIIRWCISD